MRRDGQVVVEYLVSCAAFAAERHAAKTVRLTDIAGAQGLQAWVQKCCCTHSTSHLRHFPKGRAPNESAMPARNHDPKLEKGIRKRHRETDPAEAQTASVQGKRVEAGFACLDQPLDAFWLGLSNSSSRIFGHDYLPFPTCPSVFRPRSHLQP